MSDRCKRDPRSVHYLNRYLSRHGRFTPSDPDAQEGDLFSPGLGQELARPFEGWISSWANEGICPRYCLVPALTDSTRVNARTRPDGWILLGADLVVSREPSLAVASLRHSVLEDDDAGVL